MQHTHTQYHTEAQICILSNLGLIKEERKEEEKEREERERKRALSNNQQAIKQGY